MTKIMLVEDDKSLREIYGVRLLAEGYDIVTANDGEAALAMAIKERPQLIISDVMMPKISGFDMLDILRSTTETKEIKVIMMTALSSEDQRQRGVSLGADKYLVKSQVGIEDVVRVVHELLGDSAVARPTSGPPASAAPTPATQRSAVPAHGARPAPATVPVPSSPTTPPAPPQPPTQGSMPKPMTFPAPQPASNRTRVIQPLNHPATSQVNINELLDKELAREAGVNPNNIEAQTIAEEKQEVANELDQLPPPSGPPIPSVSISDNGTIAPQPPKKDEPESPVAPGERPPIKPAE